MTVPQAFSFATDARAARVRNSSSKSEINTTGSRRKPLVSMKTTSAACQNTLNSTSLHSTAAAAPKQNSPNREGAQSTESMVSMGGIGRKSFGFPRRPISTTNVAINTKHVQENSVELDMRRKSILGPPHRPRLPSTTTSTTTETATLEGQNGGEEPMSKLQRRISQHFSKYRSLNIGLGTATTGDSAKRRESLFQAKNNVPKTGDTTISKSLGEKDVSTMNPDDLFQQLAKNLMARGVAIPPPSASRLSSDSHSLHNEKHELQPSGEMNAQAEQLVREDEATDVQTPEAPILKTHLHTDDNPPLTSNLTSLKLQQTEAEKLSIDKNVMEIDMDAVPPPPAPLTIVRQAAVQLRYNLRSGASRQSSPAPSPALPSPLSKTVRKAKQLTNIPHSATKKSGLSVPSPLKPREPKKVIGRQLPLEQAKLLLMKETEDITINMADLNLVQGSGGSSSGVTGTQKLKSRANVGRTVKELKKPLRFDQLVDDDDEIENVNRDDEGSSDVNVGGLLEDALRRGLGFDSAGISTASSMMQGQNEGEQEEDDTCQFFFNPTSIFTNSHADSVKKVRGGSMPKPKRVQDLMSPASNSKRRSSPRLDNNDDTLVIDNLESEIESPTSEDRRCIEEELRKLELEEEKMLAEMGMQL